MPSHIILIAHGSKDPRWRESFEELYNDLKKEMGEKNISLAYLGSNSPSLKQVVSSQVSNGFKNFKVLPLFMAGGGHVDSDIPEQIDEVKNKHQAINIELLPPVGEHPQIVDLIKKLTVTYSI